jgi:hypothetical protein
MTTDDLSTPRLFDSKDEDYVKRFGEACVALTEACISIARDFDVCPLCLMYETADFADDAEEKGEAWHIRHPPDDPSTDSEPTHPAHKTVV